MRTRPGAAILGAAFFFLVIGLAIRRWEMVSLMLPLIMMVVLAPLAFPRPRIDLRISRTFGQDRPQKGEEVEIGLKVHNVGSAFDMVQLEDKLPEGAVLTKGRNHFPLGLAVDGTFEMTYHVVFPRRGRYLFQRWTRSPPTPVRHVQDRQLRAARGRGGDAARAGDEAAGDPAA